MGHHIVGPIASGVQGREEQNGNFAGVSRRLPIGGFRQVIGEQSRGVLIRDYEFATTN